MDIKKIKEFFLNHNNLLSVAFYLWLFMGLGTHLFGLHEEAQTNLLFAIICLIQMRL